MKGVGWEVAADAPWRLGRAHARTWGFSKPSWRFPALYTAETVRRGAEKTLYKTATPAGGPSSLPATCATKTRSCAELPIMLLDWGSLAVGAWGPVAEGLWDSPTASPGQREICLQTGKWVSKLRNGGRGVLAMVGVSRRRAGRRRQHDACCDQPES